MASMLARCSPVVVASGAGQQKVSAAPLACTIPAPQQRSFAGKAAIHAPKGCRLPPISALTSLQSAPQLDDVLNESAGKLVVVQVASPNVNEAGHRLSKYDNGKYPALKQGIKAIAQECPDISFVDVDVGGLDDPICKELGIDTLPSLQFYMGNVLVFSHKGFTRLQEELGEGVLYYGDALAGNKHASDFVPDLGNQRDIDAFVSSQPEEVLAVVNVSTYMCEPCMHMFGAVVSVAQSFEGYATFARLIGEEDGDFEKLMGDLKIVEVPTFLFYKGGKEVGRHVGDTRDLIAKIIETQQRYGIAPPQPAHRRRAGTTGAPKPKSGAKKNPWHTNVIR